MHAQPRLDGEKCVSNPAMRIKIAVLTSCFNVWLGTFIFIFHILGIIIPTDFHIFQMGSNHQPETCFDPIH